MGTERYKISNRNIYGFKTNMYQMFLLIPAMMVIILVLEFAISPILYRYYKKNATQKEGEPGNVAGEEIRVAGSIEDMERMDVFTLLEKGVVINHDTVRSGDQIYHRITLASGEKVIAHINKKAIQKTGEAGMYRLPVGVWKAWEAPGEIMVFEKFLAVTDHYVDMYGDYVPVLSEADYSRALGSKASAWVYVIGVLLYRVVGVRKKRFAPALLWNRDPLLPRNDLECWCATTFAIWAHSFDMLEGWPLVTGAHGSRKVLSNFRKVALGEQWGIKNRQDGLEAVHGLVETHAGRLDTAYAGWDLCRATQLLGMMYLVKMIGRDEMDREFSTAGKVIQQRFSSWDALVESYLDGYRAWLGRMGEPDAERHAVRRRDIFLQLKANPDGPYSVPFPTDLTWMPGNKAGEREVVKRVLLRYRAEKIYS